MDNEDKSYEDLLQHSVSTFEEKLPEPKIFFFKSNVTFHLAQQKAEDAKKKALFSNIFSKSSLNKTLNLLKGKSDVIYQDLYEYRLEPFWFIEGSRTIEYNKKRIFPIYAENDDINQIHILNHTFDLKSNDERLIPLEAIEYCSKKIDYSFYKDGMGRKIDEESLSIYLTKFSQGLIEYNVNSKKIKSLKDANNQEPSRLNPVIQLHEIETDIKKILLNQNIEGKITNDTLTINKICIFYRPIFAFKYKWISDNSDIIIEVDALTGDVITNGSWFKDKLGKAITAETVQDILVGIGCEAMNKVIPFSGTATQALYNRMQKS